jgi:chromosome segregation ATPase
MTKMVHKENEMMQELQLNISEFNDKLEKGKLRVREAKEERDAARKEWERARKEAEGLKELIMLKDRQIEEQLDADERDKQAMEKLGRENKELRNSLTKREFEMKELVRTLKFYSEEKMRLEKEVEKLNRENDQLIGHKNPSQKI